MITWSDYSNAIAEHYVQSNNNLLVQACPGSGKTTNLKRLWDMREGSTAYVVFAKRNQLEAEAKIPKKKGNAVLTLNGLGHRMLAKYNDGTCILNTNKVSDIVKHTIKFNGTRKETREQYVALCKAVRIAKTLALPDELDVDLLLDALDNLDVEQYPGIHRDVVKVLAASDDMTDVIDFEDQIRLPVLLGLDGLVKFNNVLADEVQDFNGMQMRLVQLLQGDKYIFVGDEHQSIFGFRGALPDSMERIKNIFQCDELPLSISYRCPLAVVNEARKLYTDIEPWEQQQQGSVEECKESVFVQKLLQENLAASLVLCRNNAPLIALAFDMLSSSIPCHVLGRDIGDGLIALVRKFNTASVRHLLSELDQWKVREQSVALAQDKPDKYQRIQDRYDCLMIFCGQCSLSDSSDCVVEKINTIFSEGKGVCLSTVHKAKGLEARHVYIYKPSLLWNGIKHAKKSWQATQAKNLLYVAITRAMESLTYITE